jgi:isocitrate lyase
MTTTDSNLELIQKHFLASRFQTVIRPYSAKNVLNLRGSFPLTSYPSNIQAKKLWHILSSRQSSKTASLTFGALDPVQVIQMAKYLDTVYVSGWQCSSTASITNGISL